MGSMALFWRARVTGWSNVYWKTSPRAPAVAAFRRQHPKVTIELHSDVLAYRTIEEHDITLLTDHVPLSAGAVMRPVVDSESIFCASPDYVRGHGEPQAPQELLRRARGVVRG